MGDNDTWYGVIGISRGALPEQGNYFLTAEEINLPAMPPDLQGLYD